MAIDFTRTAVQGLVDYDTFGCNPIGASPETPDRLAPHVTIQRAAVASGDLLAPDGRKLKFWGFADPLSPILAERDAVYPSPTIRVRQGQIVHTTLTSGKSAHTIHHHGIEPTTMNDGVGHVSFEVKDSYTYQWQPQHAGTFFYHCHRNTVLHFEMGMLGLLIVDPPQGPGYLQKGDAAPRYDVEKAWVFDDMDPRWHELDDGNHDAGLCGEDVGLNRFEPKYFLVSGVFSNNAMTDKRAMVSAKPGNRILLRLLNASYSCLRITLECDALCVGRDGHGLGMNPWSGTQVLPKNVAFDMVTAQRFDLILTPPSAGTYKAKIEFRHWITDAIQNNGAGVINTRIVVS